MATTKSNIFRISRWIAWAENSAVVLIISFAFYITLPVTTAKTLFIPQGSIGSIITTLSKQKYNVSKIDSYILRLLGTPKNGWITLEKSSMNRIDFLYKLTSSKSMIHKVTLIPGETLVLFFEQLEKQLELNSTKLSTAYHHFSTYPEAGIYADTYHVPHGIKEKNLISFLVRTSEKKYQKISKNIYEDYNQTAWLRILTIASIIQKEAANNEEMPLVSSVIYNRLKKKMRLQMDGTLNYGKYSHIRVTPQRIKKDTSRFNTYKYKGLPPSPIGAVSYKAIEAAIHPASTNYLFFMKNAEGFHDFTDTFKKHRKNIRKKQQQQ